MHRLEQRLKALEAQQVTRERSGPAPGFLLDPRGIERVQALCNARGETWHRRPGESDGDFLARAAAEATAPRTWPEGIYRRGLMATDLNDDNGADRHG